jgi:UDP-N-acetylmuramoyl-tripeptide--D-alanyl-D-alanine ligase
MKQLFKNTVTKILTIEAKLLLKRHKPTIIAITGSVGKTSSKDAIYTAIKGSVHARKSEKSFNSDIGVALTILGLHNGWSNPLSWIKNIADGLLQVVFGGEYPKVLVLEMGVDRPGDMKRLTEWIRPHIVVLTRLPEVPVHVEFFSSPQQVAEEKMTLVHALRPQGTLLYNADDQKIISAIKEVSVQALGFGHAENAHFHATSESLLYKGDVLYGTSFSIRNVNGEEGQVEVHGAVGTQHTYAYTAAVGVASILDIPLPVATLALQEHVLPQGRMRLFDGIHGSRIIDDTYNSSPTACEHALATLAQVETKGKKIAVLGDMLELGQFSVQEHTRIGERIAGRADILVTVGVRARAIAETALARGMSEDHVFQFDDAKQAIPQLTSIVGEGDVILVKASQGIRAERIVEALLQDPHTDKNELVRQDTMWQRK